MTSIHFFAQEGCQGASSEVVTQDLSDLSSIGFLKRVKSMRVEGNPCVVFKGKDFQGNFELFREGDHDSLGDFSKEISSVRVVKGGLGDPEITVYEHVNYRGKSVTLTSATPSLKPFEMNDMLSSYQVKKGAWCLYENEDYEGACIVALAGDEQPNYCDIGSIGFNDIPRSLKPYRDLLSGMKGN